MMNRIHIIRRAILVNPMNLIHRHIYRIIQLFSLFQIHRLIILSIMHRCLIKQRIRHRVHVHHLVIHRTNRIHKLNSKLIRIHAMEHVDVFYGRVKFVNEKQLQSIDEKQQR